MESLNTQVAANVRAEMARRRARQSDLAQVLDLSQSAVSKRLAGTIPLDLDELGGIATFLNVPIENLLRVTAAKESA